MKKIASVLMVSLMLLSLYACGSNKDTVVIASKPMTEQYILVEMLTYLVEENTDLEVEQELGLAAPHAQVDIGNEDGPIAPHRCHRTVHRYRLRRGSAPVGRMPPPIPHPVRRATDPPP